MFIKRTDLALEARELWQESAERTTRLMGVKATKSKLEGYPVTRVDILDHRGEEALGKPQGSYFTIDLTTFWQRKADFFERAVRAVGTELKALLPVEGSALVVGLGAAVSLVLTSAGIIDTVVMNLSNLLNYIPLILKAPAMFLVNIVINFFIPSGNGQAAVVMPIMAPMSDVIGISRQNAVYCFKLGDGLCNYILPHASALMGFLGVTGVPYDKWMKFMWKLFLIWALTSCVMIGIAQAIHFGPM